MFAANDPLPFNNMYQLAPASTWVAYTVVVKNESAFNTMQIVADATVPDSIDGNSGILPLCPMECAVLYSSGQFPGVIMRLATNLPVTLNTRSVPTVTNPAYPPIMQLPMFKLIDQGPTFPTGNITYTPAGVGDVIVYSALITGQPGDVNGRIMMPTDRFTIKARIGRTVVPGNPIIIRFYLGTALEVVGTPPSVAATLIGSAQPASGGAGVFPNSGVFRRTFSPIGGGIWQAWIPTGNSLFSDDESPSAVYNFVPVNITLPSVSSSVFLSWSVANAAPHTDSGTIFEWTLFAGMA